MKPVANSGRELEVVYKGKTYVRYPIETHFIGIGENLEEILEKYASTYLKPTDLLCISTKIISICTPGLTVHKDSVKITPLARLIVKFVKKWPNDIGYSNPRKMQVAINMAGYSRIFLALTIGTLMKLLGKPGYFYRIAGNQINAIDGFTVGYTKRQIFADYAFLPPKPKAAQQMCNDLAKIFKTNVIFLDGNNIENNLMGQSDSVKQKYTEQDLKQILRGNPQGQEDDGNNTPILIVRKVE
jgi:hypothetical protein